MKREYFRIAETTVGLDCTWLSIPAALREFSISEKEAEAAPLRYLWSVAEAEEAFPDDSFETSEAFSGPTLFDTRDLKVRRNADGLLIVTFPPYPAILRLELGFRHSRVFFNAKTLSGLSPRRREEDILYPLEMSFFHFIRSEGKAAIHSASILYEGGAYLFSAPSGTGKTTHVNLWREALPEQTKILDGDVAAVGFHEGAPCAWGLPWSGTSGVFLNQRAPLKGVVFLRRGTENRAARLPASQAALHLLARCFSPSWTREMTAANLEICRRLSQQVPCYTLECLPEPSAVTAIRALLDEDRTPA